jgi:hypothetical protein
MSTAPAAVALAEVLCAMRFEELPERTVELAGMLVASTLASAGVAKAATAARGSA